jgi:dTDP-4-dehydrorhamnose reductase
MLNRIALVGADGQLGRELRQRLGERVVALGHTQIELTDADSVEAAIAAADPEMVINAAAYNLVDRAEEEPNVAFAVNAYGPRNLAIACDARDIPLLHVSTDFVFSGKDKTDAVETQRSLPYVESDRPVPLCEYGKSKRAGERYVGSLCRRQFVVRTCGLYGPTTTPGRGNFVQTMLRLGRERGEVGVVNDQTCCPTATADLAGAIEALIATDAYGLYHATNTGSTTWYDFAREIFRLAAIDVAVQPISSAEFGAKAARPCYSVLNTRKLTDVTGFEMPAWQEALERYLGMMDGTPS